MWTICDIAMHVINFKAPSYDTREFSIDARIPSMYFQAQPEDFQNSRTYIPGDMFIVQQVPKKPAMPFVVSYYLIDFPKILFMSNIFFKLFLGTKKESKKDLRK